MSDVVLDVVAAVVPFVVVGFASRMVFKVIRELGR